MSEEADPAPVEKKGHALVARAPAGSLDDETLKTLHRAIDQAVAAEPSVTLIILDLAQVSFIPSMGLGLLVQFASKCKARQQALRLAGVQPKVRQEFCVARLDRLFRFSQTVNEAMT
jgi:anti-anti-sigma factor